jgi:AraC-like DNA-binding protein
MNKNGRVMNYQKQYPGEELSAYIKCFWALENPSSETIPVVILPDGYFDILFVSVDSLPFRASLVGLATIQTTFEVPARSRTFAVSFKLPAAEYLLNSSTGALLDSWKYLPQGYWELTNDNFCDMDSFVKSVTAVMALSPALKTDARKLALFSKLYETDGAILINQLAESIGWGSRQINRYFQSNFGLSLKKYCTILRFRASFDHLHNGQLSPLPSYFDQPHFIREVHKFAGTSPKHLFVNQKDRFIQLSTLSVQ